MNSNSNVTHDACYNIYLPKNTPIKILLKETIDPIYVRFSENLSFKDLNGYNSKYPLKDFTNNFYFDSSDGTKIHFVPFNSNLKKFDLKSLFFDRKYTVNNKDCFLKKGPKNDIRGYKHFSCSGEFSFVEGEKYELVIEPYFYNFSYDKYVEICKTNNNNESEYIKIYQTSSQNTITFFYQY